MRATTSRVRVRDAGSGLPNLTPEGRPVGLTGMVKVGSQKEGTLQQLDTLDEG